MVKYERKGTRIKYERRTVMKTKTVIVLAALVCGLLMVGGGVWAMSSGSYAIDWDVIGGGGEPASSASYGLRGTIGQPAAESSSSASYGLCSGYWYPAAPAGPPPEGTIWDFPSTSDVFFAPTPANNRPYLDAVASLPSGTEPAELNGVYRLDEGTGEWQYFIPGFAGSTLTSLEPGENYLVAVSGACSWNLPCGEGAASPTGNTWSFGSTSDVFLAPTPANNRPYLDAVVDLPTGTEPAELSGVYWLDEATGEWQYFVPGFAGSTLISLDLGEAYLVAVSGACNWQLS
jgi:hypothetical protein